MGLYIEVPEARAKAYQMAELHGAQPIERPTAFDPPPGKTLLCVVSNPMFDAVAICCDGEDFRRFTAPDPRPSQWMLLDTQVARALNPRYAAELDAMK